METEFRLTGRHVLFTLIGFFLMILTANVIFINYAMKTYPGEKVEKSYLQGLNYNDRLDARAAQTSLGWKTTIDEASLDGDELTLKITISGKGDMKLSYLKVDGVLSRPATAASDQTIEFTSIGNGRYLATATVRPGLWELDGKAVNARNDEFIFSNRLILSDWVKNGS